MIRGCSIDRVMQDHGGYATKSPDAAPVKPVRVRTKPAPKPIIVTDGVILTRAEKQEWKRQMRTRMAAANITPTVLARASGYSQATCLCNFSPSSDVSNSFVRNMSAAMEELERTPLPAIERPVKITAEWVRVVRRKRSDLGLTWGHLALVSGYTLTSVQSACREGWAMPPHKKAAIEAALGLSESGL